ncbi:hypothetical protein D3C81_1075890 [compost metagenome]
MDNDIVDEVAGDNIKFEVPHLHVCTGEGGAIHHGQVVTLGNTADHHPPVVVGTDTGDAFQGLTNVFIRQNGYLFAADPVGDGGFIFLFGI